MTLYLLDTDHLSQYQRGHAAVMRHLASKTPAQVFTSVITAEEIMRGRLAQIRSRQNRSRTHQGLLLTG